MLLLLFNCYPEKFLCGSWNFSVHQVNLLDPNVGEEQKWLNKNSPASQEVAPRSGEDVGYG